MLGVAVGTVVAGVGRAAARKLGFGSGGLGGSGLADAWVVLVVPLLCASFLLGAVATCFPLLVGVGSGDGV